MLGKLPFNGLDRFKYIIITPQNNSNVIENTFFNQVPMSIIDSLSCLIFISHFPSTFTEFFAEWPISICNYFSNSDYDISYVNEKSVNSDFLNYIKDLRLGILFISKEVGNDAILKIKLNSHIPVVVLNEEEQDGFFNLSDDSILKIYKLFSDILSEKTTNLPLAKIDTLKKIRDIDTNIPPYHAPVAKYLDPLTIIIDRIRGLYYKSGSGIYQIDSVNPKTHSEYELMADTEIYKALQVLIAEKFLTLNIGFYIEGSLDDNDRNVLRSMDIDENSLQEFLLTKDPILYLSMSEKITQSLEKVTIKTDMTLCIPSVNYEYVRSFFSKDVQGKEYNKISKEAFRLSFDMNTYYGLINMEGLNNESKEKQEHNLQLALYFIGQRGAENTFHSLLFVFLTLSHKDPFVRTRNIPSYKLWSDLKRLSDIVENNELYSKSKDINQIITLVSETIRQQIFNSTNNLEMMIARYANHITVLSDLPVEWIRIDSVPLFIKKRMSRMPLTPGDYLASFVQDNQTSYEINNANINILIINALRADDHRHIYGENLYHRVNSISDNWERIKYVEVKNKSEYIDSINKIKPNVLIHFGHGAYNRWESRNKFERMHGALIINDEILSSSEIDSITNFPKIVVLGACTTEVPQGPNYNIANTFLSGGALSVIGTFIPVNADYTSDFIANLIHHFYLCLSNKSKEIISNWSDIVYIVRNQMYIEEPVYCLTNDYKKGKLRNKVKAFDPVSKFIDYCKTNIVSFDDSLKNRDDIYTEVFKSNLELYEAFKNISLSKAITPYISFYTSLGSPEKIHISKD